MNLPERRADQPRSPAESETNITGFRPADRASHISVEVGPSLVSASDRHAAPDPAFWTELNATIDAFYSVIGQSHTRIAELSSEVIKRDAMITLLEAQNVALRARLGIADVIPPAVHLLEITPAPPSTQDAVTDRRSDLGIWERLTNLDRSGA